MRKSKEVGRRRGREERREGMRGGEGKRKRDRGGEGRKRTKGGRREKGEKKELVTV